MKFYRKQPIEAEQFDGSDEMVDKYELIDAGTMLGTHHSPELYLTGSGKVDVGDWIATGVNGEHWLIADDVFKQTYAELPVIPKVWGDAIEEFKANHYQLSEMFNEWDWNYDEQELIARAWLDGYQVEGHK
ncbi:DUF1642 domain-containing protein [Lactiplantibacillus plantarum]|uniref:DUF1642 domain-containing protein n=1 Tax=Lactiplantibacillus plantarum TaxID=1590 RepID=UPI000BBBFD87|nr:DUF1642 domain-containing protein [Lactiplantibacillus plantarum]MBH5331686.1 DUF1642 domain-containing protein [Lactiplantibacillus plantarum]PCE83161.1 hypothetical protein CJP43_06810 [Lactiplantibacillus plantarum]TYA18930.1 DUF1642 domain-containing protein [Lactobacillus sp. LSI2-1]